jgi:hypothetical protein
MSYFNFFLQTAAIRANNMRMKDSWFTYVQQFYADEKLNLLSNKIYSLLFESLAVRFVLFKLIF